MFSNTDGNYADLNVLLLEICVCLYIPDVSSETVDPLDSVSRNYEYNWIILLPFNIILELGGELRERINQSITALQCIKITIRTKMINECVNAQEIPSSIILKTDNLLCSITWIC